jgi:rhodanese-related sulfurtransferase
MGLGSGKKQINQVDRRPAGLTEPFPPETCRCSGANLLTSTGGRHHGSSASTALSENCRRRQAARPRNQCDEVKARLDRGEKFVLVDVREDREFDADHLPGAVHLGKGIIERDIEGKYPDLKTELVLYCGGGFRSALAADNLQKMGYTNVISMDGGIRDWREKGYPLEK